MSKAPDNAPTMTDKPIIPLPLPAADYITEDRRRFWNVTSMNEHARAAVLADRALNATAQGMWQPIETAPKNPIKRVLLRWVSGQSEWICIGAWASADDSPRLKIAGCPREGWMPDAGTCIPRNQKDCVGWMRLPAAAPIPAVDAVAGEPVRAALAELVALKDMKEAFNATDYSAADPVTFDAARAEYARRKPLAWRAARDVLATPPRAGSETAASASEVERLQADLVSIRSAWNKAEEELAAAMASVQGVAEYHARCGDIAEEATLRRAVSVMDDVLGDIADWEDKALSWTVEASRRDLQAMVDAIGLRAQGVMGAEVVDLGINGSRCGTHGTSGS